MRIAELRGKFQTRDAPEYETGVLSIQHKFWQYLAKKKVKVKFTLEQATKAQRGSRGIALPFL
jgi:hypothetical protein